MKKLLVLTAVAILSASALGCRCGSLFSRGPSCPTCGQAGSAGYGGDTYGGEGYGMPPAGMPQTYAVPGPG